MSSPRPSSRDSLHKSGMYGQIYSSPGIKMIDVDTLSIYIYISSQDRWRGFHFVESVSCVYCSLGIVVYARVPKPHGAWS